ncbi:hypothetical protein GW17_00039551, partial [Ensete ventricosum]
RYPRDFLRRFGSGADGGQEGRAVRGRSSTASASRWAVAPGTSPRIGCTASVFAFSADAGQRKRKELRSRKRKRSEKRDRKGDTLNEEMEDGQRPSAAANGVVPPLPPALATKPRAGMVDGSKCCRPETQASIGTRGSGCSVVSDFDCRAKQGYNGVSRLLACLARRTWCGLVSDF